MAAACGLCCVGAVLYMFYVTLCRAQHHAIVSTRLERVCPDGSIGDGDAMDTFQLDSPLECWSKCGRLERCVAGKWHSGICSVYSYIICSTMKDNSTSFGKKGRCGEDASALIDGSSSKYYISPVLPKNVSWYDAGDLCYPRASHLIAVETQQEYEFFKTHFETDNGGCDMIWTGGFTDNPGNSSLEVWKWNMTTSIQPFTFIQWARNQPNNVAGIQYVYVLYDKPRTAGVKFEFGDMEYVQASNFDYCYICECY